MQMKELVERIVRALVDHPNEVEVREVTGINVKLLQIKVSMDDMGKLIGRRGRNIEAIGSIVSAAGKGKRYMVEVLGEGRSNPRRICQGKVKSVFEDQNHGFIEVDDGTSLYFHGSSLKEVGIGSLLVGQPVEFETVESSKGFRVVSTVRPASKDS